MDVVTSFLRDFHVVFDVASCLLNLSIGFLALCVNMVTLPVPAVRRKTVVPPRYENEALWAKLLSGAGCSKLGYR